MKALIRYRRGYKYQLAEGYQVQTALRPSSILFNEYVALHPDGTLSISEGYAWDGCSGPTWDDKTNMRGGLVHDALCQLMREGLLGAENFDAVNGELRRIISEDSKLRADGSWWKEKIGQLRAWYYFRAVEDFGKCAATAGANPYPILTAP